MTLVFDILTTSCLLFIITSGLMMIFGVMQIVNFAHGAIISVGGYLAFCLAAAGVPPLYSALSAFAVGFVLGALIVRFIVKPLYKRPLDAILATWGLGIVLIQLIIMIFGRSVQMVDSPIEGTWHLLGVDYSAYRLAMIPVAVVMFAVILIMLNGTLYGIKTRAIIMNEALAQGLGINSDLIRLLTFSIGAGLGTLAGMFITPLTSVDPYMGVAMLTNAFMIVMVSGHSFIALMLSCLVFGLCQVIISIYINPVVGSMAISCLAAAVLRIRPQGFSYE